MVDASIFPGMPSTNPSALVVTAAERASEIILALPQNTAVEHVRIPDHSFDTGYSLVANYVQYGQCGGSYYSGSTYCAPPYVCTYDDPEFSQVSLPLLHIKISY